MREMVNPKLSEFCKTYPRIILTLEDDSSKPLFSQGKQYDIIMLWKIELPVPDGLSLAIKMPQPYEEKQAFTIYHP